MHIRINRFAIIKITHRTCIGLTELPSSNTGLSIEYVAGGGDLDFLILVKRRIKETHLSFFSFGCNLQYIWAILCDIVRIDTYLNVFLLEIKYLFRGSVCSRSCIWGCNSCYTQSTVRTSIHIARGRGRSGNDGTATAIISVVESYRRL